MAAVGLGLGVAVLGRRSLGVENRTQAAALVHRPPTPDEPGDSLIGGDEGAAARL